jgi:MFS family permease
VPVTPTPRTDQAAGEGLFSPRLRGASTAIFTTMALAAFEGLAVAAALPLLAGDLGDVALLPWVITAYLLPSGVATVAAGALVDRLGVARVFKVAVVLFVLGGALAGVAPSMPLVIAARLLQGIGSGAVSAVALAAVGLIYPSRLVGRAFAANATVWGAMSIAGPAIAAALITVASWRWIFLLNVPLGAAALAAGWRALPTEPPAQDGAHAVPIRLDPLVLGLLSTITFGSLWAVDRLDLLSLPALVVVLLAGWVLLRRERGRPGALIAPRHVVDAPLGPLAWGVCLLLTGSIGLATYVPLYLTAGRGVGASTAAWSVVVFTLGWTAGANASSRLMDRMPAMRVTLLGAAVTPLGLAAVALGVWSAAPLWLLAVPVLVAGTGVGAATNSALTTLRAVAVSSELGRATAAHQFVRNFGFAMGNALVGAVLLFVVGSATGDVEAVRAVLADGSAGGGAQGAEIAGAIQDGLAVAVAIGAAIAAAAVIPLRRVPADAGTTG